jgi:hypothetical protein
LCGALRSRSSARRPPGGSVLRDWPWVTDSQARVFTAGKGALGALEDAAGAKRFNGQHVALCGYNEPLSKWLSDFEAATGDTPLTTLFVQ